MSLLVIFLLVITASQVEAQVIINEVFPAPEQGSEWIELYNPNSQEVELDGWWLEDQLSSPTVVARLENEILLAQNFLVIELSSAKLNNSADGVVLKNSQAEVIDQMSYKSSRAGFSWSKNTAGFFELTLPTKNMINIFPSPSPTIAPSPTPTSSPTPTPNITKSKPTPTTNKTTPASPTPPPPPHSTSQPILSFDSTISATQNKLTNIVTQKLPKTALLSVILGGSWLLFSSSWKIHEKISQQR